MKCNAKLNTRSVIVYFTLGIIGSLIIFYSTPYGPKVFSDSTIYIMSAKNLAAGHGLGVYLPSGRFDPLVIFAPLYPLVMSIAAFLEVDLVLATRVLVIALFGLLIITECILVHSLTHSFWLSLVVGLFTLTSPLFLSMYTSALSEPIFLFLELLGLLLLCIFISSDKRWSLLISAVLFGLAAISRYIGIAGIVSGCICLMLLVKAHWKQRLYDVMIFIAISVLPLASSLFWLGKPSVQDPLKVKISISQFWTITRPFRARFVDAVWNLFSLPTYLKSFTYREKLYILMFLFLLLISFISWAWWKVRLNASRSRSTYQRITLISLMYIFIVVFIMSLMLAYMYRVPQLVLDTRQLVPLLLPSIIILFTSIFLIAERFLTSHLSIFILLIFTVLVIAPSIPKSVQLVMKLHESGDGYAGKEWRSAAIIQEVKKLPSSIPIISNEPGLVHFYIGRMPYDIPELRSPDPLKEFIRFGDDYEDGVQRIFREEGAALVIFPLSFYWQMCDLYFEETDLRIETFTQGLNQHFSSGSGDIYYYPHENNFNNPED